MPKEETEALKARNQQSTEAKRATLEMLRAKKRAEKELFVLVPGEDGDEEISFLLRAISIKEYDRLLSANPPNAEQRADGGTFNMHTMAPQLFSKVIVEPALTAKEWEEIWNSPDWTRGELVSLFAEASSICNSGLRLGPTATG